MTIVDTTVWIDYLAWRREFTHRLARPRVESATCRLTDLILCEVLQVIRGFAFGRGTAGLVQDRGFRYRERNVAVACAQYYCSLRTLGYSVRKPIDCLTPSVSLRDIRCFAAIMPLIRARNILDSVFSIR